MLVNFIIDLHNEPSRNILTTEQTVLDAVLDAYKLKFVMVKGVQGDGLMVPVHMITGMSFTPVQVQNENKQSESEGEKSIEPSEE